MSKATTSSTIRLRGVRHHNLKHFDLDLPQHRLIVITGVSGSGKSSLAFDTLFAEGQRRYIETFSPYARQFFDRMDKPQVDSIEGIPPAIAIEQRNAVRTTRSTVGTMTEVCDYLKLLWPHLARLHCRQCGQVVQKDAPRQIWDRLAHAAGEVLITFDLPLSDKLSLAESLALIVKQGYQRLLCAGAVLDLENAPAKLAALHPPPTRLSIVQDRLRLTPAHRARFVEACEQAYHFGKGKLTVHELAPGNPPGSPLAIRSSRPFSHLYHCAACDLEYREPSPPLFSFNHPLGACPACRGFGRTIGIDYGLAIPDPTLTLTQGAIKPWRGGYSAECQDDLLKFCRKRGVPVDVPFRELSPAHQAWVRDGDPHYGRDKQHEWPLAWYGVKGYFRWLESKAYKMHMRVLLSRYRAYSTCPACLGKRFQPESLLFRLPGTGGAAPSPPSLSLADFYALPLRQSLEVVECLATRPSFSATDPLGLVLGEVRSRLGYLVEIGLGYLTLDRPTRSLSGGETERVNLTTCLGTRLVNTLYVLDEPSVGLHPRDTDRLARILARLRDTGNTVVVVEHEPGIIRAADQVVDLGPGAGEAGGQVVFQGSYAQMLRSRASLTGSYLSGRQRIAIPQRRPVDIHQAPALLLSGVSRHNLKDLTVRIPLCRLVGVTGVSGSGKTTLVRECLLPALEARLNQTVRRPPTAENDRQDEAEDQCQAPAFARLSGWQSLGRVVLVDQTTLGKTPRSNPAVYLGAFDDIREFFAQSEPARQRGLNASAFSFNSTQGQCEHCRGAGFEKIEMQFLSDVFIRCPDCDGRRYRAHILEVTVARPAEAPAAGAPRPRRSTPSPPVVAGPANPTWNIADLLEATVAEAILFLGGFADSRPAQRAIASLSLLQEVGLGYLRLGQPINTLSGGESQRLKLVHHLAECAATNAGPPAGPSTAGRKPSDRALKRGEILVPPTLFLFDEPTTGLHFDDVRLLLRVFQRLVDAGHSVLVIEHNLEVIKCADWVIDLGPEAGDEGGRLVAQGPPEHIAATPASHTGQALQAVLR